MAPRVENPIHLIFQPVRHTDTMLNPSQPFFQDGLRGTKTYAGFTPQRVGLFCYCVLRTQEGLRNTQYGADPTAVYA